MCETRRAGNGTYGERSPNAKNWWLCPAYDASPPARRRSSIDSGNGSISASTSGSSDASTSLNVCTAGASASAHADALASNPLPAPPRAHHTSLPPAQMRTPPQGTYTRRLRWGFWNRRGDYLTTDMHIVYAPREYANPPDLANYPPPMEGYRDHTNTFVRYDPSRPELQESLPSKGQPPQLPYERVRRALIDFLLLLLSVPHAVVLRQFITHVYL